MRFVDALGRPSGDVLMFIFSNQITTAMKKSTLFSLAFIFGVIMCFSQDIITMKTGEDILAKISEIGPTEIKYKKFDNLDGPLYTLLKSEILMIRYENGTNNVFKEEQKSNSGWSANSSDLNLYEQGQ